MMRNMGGSFGIAMLSTLITNREHLHSVRLDSTITAGNPAFISRLNSLTEMLSSKGLDPTTAGITATKLINNSVSQQSFLFAYGDAFFIIGSIMFASGLLLIFVKKPKTVKMGGGEG